MNFKNFIKRFQRATARYGLFVSSWLFNCLPYSLMQTITNGILFIGFQFMGKQKRIAKESLMTAFGDEKGEKEINEIIRKCFYNLGRGMIELIYFMAHPGLIPQKVSYQGREHLEKALAKGKGVVAVTAHFGNFPLMMLACAKDGFKANAIIRPMRDEKLEEYLLQKRKECGLNTVYAVPRRQCVADSLKALRSNEILFIPLDQNFGSDGGVFVKFFGQKAATATGPVVFSTRTQASIIPMFIIRENEDQHKIIIEPPIELEQKDDDQEMLVVNTMKITNLIEKYVRKYPYEWGWMHRRWKSKPYDIKYLPNA